MSLGFSVQTGRMCLIFFHHLQGIHIMVILPSPLSVIKIIKCPPVRCFAEERGSGASRQPHLTLYISNSLLLHFFLLLSLSIAVINYIPIVARKKSLRKRKKERKKERGRVEKRGRRKWL